MQNFDAMTDVRETKLKVRDTALVIFLHAVALLSLSGGLVIGGLVFALIPLLGPAAIVGELFWFCIIYFAAGFYWWRLARFTKRMALEAAGKKVS